MQATTQASGVSKDDRIDKIIKFCEEPKSRDKIQEYVGIKNREYFRNEILNPLIKKDLLQLTLPNKPMSPK